MFAVDNWKFEHKTYKKFVEIEHIKDIYQINLKKNGVREYITDITMDSHLAAGQFEDKSLDFVFIDADHRYEYTKRDILAWLPKIKNGGIIAGHDYISLEAEREEPDVKMAVDELRGLNILKNVSFHQGNVWHTDIYE
jgi:predicted O-methyltransferase YrrM